MLCGAAEQAAKKALLLLILGGAAVYRCDQRPVFRAGFSR
jgi:hypothetical protein